MAQKVYKSTSKITGVSESEDGYSISRADSTGCFMSKEYGVELKAGDKLTIYSDGPFGTIRGMDLNGNRVYWRTEKQIEDERQVWLRKHEEDKQRAFKENMSKMDKRYDALPKIFQDRIDRFRQNNSRFRIDFEEYELFCCEQAVAIANACGSAEEVREFAQKDWDEQKAQVPGLSDGHSGNTFGCSCRLAYFYLSQPENVTKMHGALSPLVGSREYGDVPKY